MKIDGATEVIYAELGFPATLARGLSCLSRLVESLSHAWENALEGGRNNGPIPRDYLNLRWTKAAIGVGGRFVKGMTPNLSISSELLRGHKPSQSGFRRSLTDRLLAGSVNSFAR